MVWRTEIGAASTEHFAASVWQIFELGPHPFGENGMDFYLRYEWKVYRKLDFQMGGGISEVASGVHKDSRLAAMREAEDWIKANETPR